MTLTLPIYWTNTKKTKKDTTHLLGMNFFRNAYFHVQAKVKRDYHELVLNQLPKKYKCKQDQFKMHYRLYYKSPVCDASNIIALVEKFTLDALSSADIIIDDNVKYHLSSSWEIIEQDKDDPRVEVTLTELAPQSA